MKPALKTTVHNWLPPLTLALVVYPLFYFYNVVYRQDWGVISLSESLAATAGLLLGTSLVLASLSYFFDYLDHALSLRKYLGLTGFWIALIYCFTLIYRFPDQYGSELLTHLHLLEIQLGLAAMSIFGFMTLISTKTGIKALGPIWWRRCLRLGFLAYALLIIRAIDLEWGIWVNWLTNPQGLLPPPRLALSIFAFLVLTTRLSLLLSQKLIDSPKSTSKQST